MMLSALAIILSVLQLCSAETSTIAKSYKFPETQILTNNLWHDTAKLVYARCNATEPESGKRCIVGLNLDASNNFTELTDECKITLKPEMPNAQISNVFWVYGFGKDKAILVWLETLKDSSSRNDSGSLTLKTSVIHILDNCQVFDAKVHEYAEQQIDFSCLNLNVIIFNDYYEFTLKNVTNNCTPGSECPIEYGIFKFDAKAKKLSGPDHWPTPLFNNETAVSIVMPVEPRSPSNGYFIVNHDYFKLVTYLVTKDSNDYKKKMLWESPYVDSDWFSVFSMANKAMGWCYNVVKTNSSFSCCRWDQAGVINMKTQFEIELPNKRYLQAVHNLQQGELLVMTSTSPMCGCPDVDDERFFMMKVTEKGPVGSLEFKLEPRCTTDKSDIILKLFENDKGQYCVIQICESKFQHPTRLNTLVRCFSSDELSKCMNCL
ncbi:uncharacterized protein LOC131665512 [Phymastichus coffea]|uniref:uncharacterized protein LOC131665512 n=1 Tax=Phymastichus coffea TaxID=108790 RepID=UPI00273C7A87|nr:uncharacterized protein LOC131665512 [Phymastichus coffea]